MERHSKIYVAGHKGLVGSAILRCLKSAGYGNIVFKNFEDLDLTNRNAVDHFFETEKPEFVFLAAAKVGGIKANNDFSADFIYQNLAIQTNVIDAAYRNATKKLLFLGSSCIYPKYAGQPIKESSLLSGNLEPTNEAYAIAKIAGLKMCESYHKQYGFNAISLMPTNLYGPNDNFNLVTSHVLPALIRKVHDAKNQKTESVNVWGTGEPKREFLYVDDLADACIYCMQHYSAPSPINIGTGKDLTIKELARVICDVVGFTGNITFDPTKPDGTPRKVLDVSKIHSLGWNAKISLKEGILKTYKWYLEHASQYKEVA